MNRPTQPPPSTGDIETIYQQLLEAWNRQDANAFAALLSPIATVIGFDGSTMHGPQEVSAALAAIFKHHKTARYVWKVRAIRMLGPQVAILESVAGMVPPGQKLIKSETNAIQVMVAAWHYTEWRIESFQNTPAQFHGRPEMIEKLTAELQQLV